MIQNSIIPLVKMYSSVYVQEGGSGGGRDEGHQGGRGLDRAPLRRYH